MLDSLHHFVLVVECGTFTEAARQAHLTQPGLSASIKRLEDAFGARLLHRLPRGAAPTAAGQALLPRARAALAAVEEGRRAVVEVLGLQAGEVRIGGGTIACTYLLPPRLAAFRERYPGVTVRLRETHTPDVPLEVESGRLDLGIGEGRGDPERSDPVAEDELVVLASPEAAERWWDGERLRPGAPAITFPEGTSLRGAFDRAFDDLEIVSEVSSVSTSKGFLRAGLGVGLMPRVAVEVNLDLHRLVVLPDPRTPPPRILSLYHRGVQRLTPAATALRSALLEDFRLS